MNERYVREFRDVHEFRDVPELRVPPNLILYKLSLFVFPDKNKCISSHSAIQGMFHLISNKTKHFVLQFTILQYKFFFFIVHVPTDTSFNYFEFSVLARLV